MGVVPVLIVALDAAGVSLAGSEDRTVGPIAPRGRPAFIRLTFRTKARHFTQLPNKRKLKAQII
jgi:hypothetical protein